MGKLTKNKPFLGGKLVLFENKACIHETYGRFIQETEKYLILPSNRYLSYFH